jgi:hypothetical protein
LLQQLSLRVLLWQLRRPHHHLQMDRNHHQLKPSLLGQQLVQQRVLQLQPLEALLDQLA